MLLFAGAFRVGRAINRRVRAVTLSIAEEGDTITIQATKSGSQRGSGAGRWARFSGSGGGAYVMIRRRGGGSIPGAASKGLADE